jgi:hypothetical protein
MEMICLDGREAYREKDVPPYVVGENEKTGRFGYLLDRDRERAGSEDWEAAVENTRRPKDV